MTQQSPANPYGSDLLVSFSGNGNGDIDAGGALATGIQVLAQSLVMAQTTPQSSLLGDSTQCFDVRAWISKGMTQAQISGLGLVAQKQILRDQRVTAATVTASWNWATSTLTLVEQIQSTLGPFTLTLNVTAVTVQMLLAV